MKRSIAESVPDRASVHTRDAAFEAVSAPEQYCSAPLLKMGHSVSDGFLKRSGSSLNSLSERKLQRNRVLVNDLLKLKGSVANCMTDRACVHTGKALEQFLLRNITLILVHTVSEQILKWSKNISGMHSVNIALISAGYMNKKSPIHGGVTTTISKFTS